MNCTRETKVDLDFKIIHTKYHGDVELDFILSAIGEWLGIIHKEKQIKFLIFDYSDANMNMLTTEDVKKISSSSHALIHANPNIKLIGVMPNTSDHKLASIWAALTATSEGPTEYNNIVIMESLSDAMCYIEQKGN